MKIQPHNLPDTKIAEVTSENIVIATIEDALNLMADLYYQNYNGIILHKKNITPTFFDLRTGIAGEVLQKFSNYRMRLAIVGDFSTYKSKSLNYFIFESNKSNQINFVVSLNEALELLS